MKRLFATLLLLCSLPAGAQQYQDWYVEAVDANTVAASTRNGSGSILLKTCYVDTQQCAWMLNTDTDCENGGVYPAIANSASGSRAFQLTCIGEKKLTQLLIFNDYEGFEAVSRNDPLVGIAFPMQGGQFRVLRFSLAGSVAATAAAEEAVATAGNTTATDLTL